MPQYTAYELALGKRSRDFIKNINSEAREHILREFIENEQQQLDPNISRIKLQIYNCNTHTEIVNVIIKEHLFEEFKNITEDLSGVCYKIPNKLFHQITGISLEELKTFYSFLPAPGDYIGFYPAYIFITNSSSMI